MSVIKKIFLFVFILVAAFVLIRTYFYEPFYVPSKSMMPTLLKGDYVWVSKFKQKYKVGDVVVFRHPDDPRIYFTKRIIAGPGDEIKQVNGDLYFNNKPFVTVDLAVKRATKEDRCVALLKDESFVPLFLKPLPYFRKNKNYRLKIEMFPLGKNAHYTQRAKLNLKDESFSYVVPEGYFFVMGDNRDRAIDSREFGMVPIENMVGKVVRVWFSINESQLVCKSPLSKKGSEIMRWYRLGRQVY